VTRQDDFISAFAGTAKKAERLAIVKPADGAEFHLVQGIDQQRVVCTVAGNTASGRLWWFVDGKPFGETAGDAPFVWTPVIGRHVVTCATADGVTASAGFTVSKLE